jgi:acyl-coenzyme A thioesterase PaaI-like protein
MTPLFTDAMALRRVREVSADGQRPAHRPVAGAIFEAELNRHWTIGPKVHGGAMLALCANAARTALGDDAGVVTARGGGTPSREAAWGRAGQLGTVEPVAVSGSFLWAPDPGPMRLATSIRKRGRRISVVDVELYQGGRTAVHAVITLGEPEHRTRPLLSVNPVVELMAPEPPADVAPIGPGHPMAGLVHLAEGCDVRPLVSTLEPTEGRPPLIQMWVRPRDAPPDVLFALMCGDVSAPVSFAVNRTGWAPTVQLTAYLRGLPADGWLRVLCTCTQIGQDWFDEDHTVVDCEGRIVVQTRQLAMVPAS